MSEKIVTNLFPADREDIGDLRTVRPIPSPRIRDLDPFLFLNHHGPQVYPPDNAGLPFGPHPHRGFQTVTYILEGDIAHRDSAGHESVIGPGGVQWMSAGRGLVHEEVSSRAFMKTGGPLEILQLWINLPKRLKMSEPHYRGLQGDEIPTVRLDDGRAEARVVAGTFAGITGPFRPSTEITSAVLGFEPGGSMEIPVPRGHAIFFYVIRGKVEIGGTSVKALNLAGFSEEGDRLFVKASETSRVLLCHAEPYREPIVYGGPFVMNTPEEIRQAFLDFRSGKFE